MTAKMGKVKKIGRSTKSCDYPSPIVSGELVKLFYECFARWSQRESEAEKLRAEEERKLARYPRRNLDFIEAGKVTFANSDYSKANIEALLGGRLHWRKSLGALAVLVDCYEHVTEDKPGHHPLLPFSCRNSFLLESIGGKDSAWRVINNAIKVGLIACVDSSYWFPYHNARVPLGGRKGKCRLYAWNKEAQRELKRLARAEGVLCECKSVGLDELARISDREAAKRRSGIPPTAREQDLFNRVRVDTGLRIPAEYTDEEVMAAVIRKYPMIEATIRLVRDEINPSIDRADQKFAASVHITRSATGLVTKIGFRPAPHYVSLRKDPTALHCNGGMKSKGEYLDEHFGRGMWKEWDVKSSVPRLLYALNHGLTWLPCAQVDMYERIAADEIKQDKTAWKTVYRDQLKKLFLRANFNYSYKTTFNQLRRNGALSEFIPATSTETAKAVVRGVKDSLTQALGPTCGSEIFILESYLYLKVYAKCLKECKRNSVPIPLLFYDGFVMQRSQTFNFEHEIQREISGLQSGVEKKRMLEFFNKGKHETEDGDGDSGNSGNKEPGHQHGRDGLIVTNMSGYGNLQGFLMIEEPSDGDEKGGLGGCGPPGAGLELENERSQRQFAATG